MSNHPCIKTNIIINKILKVNEKIKKTVFVDSLNVSGGFESHTMWCKVFNDNIINIVTQIDYNSCYTNSIKKKAININDIISLINPGDIHVISYENNIKTVNGYTNSTDNSMVFIAWDKLFESITMRNSLYRRTYIETYNFIYNNYNDSIKEIFNTIPDNSYKIKLNKKFRLSIVLTKLIQFNIKLKEELIDGAQNTHIYNYILRKMSNFANLIDFGYSFKINKKNIFNNTYISLNQIYDLFMINAEEDFEDFKIFLVKSSIYLDAHHVDVDQHIFSWNQLIKIINKYTNIDSISEKKYMKYVHKMYTECILEILDEIE